MKRNAWILAALMSAPAWADGLVPAIERFKPGVVETRALARPDAQFGYLHDNAIFAFKGRLWAAWYNCPKSEMIGNSVIRGRWSDDGGETWSPVKIFAGDPNAKPDEAKGAFMYVPPAFGSDGKDLYLFASRMIGPDVVRDCEIFKWDAAGERFVSAGLMGADFIPNAAMQARTDGKWMIAGRRYVPRTSARWAKSRPTLAISETVDPAGKWRFSDISDEYVPGTKQVYQCSEPGLIAEGRRLTAFVRCSDYGAPGGCGLRVHESLDEGETWKLLPNLPFRVSPAKPAAGVLSDGRRYLIANTKEEGGQYGRRTLAIWLGEKGGRDFTRAFYLQQGDCPAANLRFEWCYPSACEFEGKLYVLASTSTDVNVKNSSGLTVVPLAAFDDPDAVERARVAGLRTNQVREPFGVTGAPTFSWRMEGNAPGLAQRAYRIALFERDAEKPVWDSGEVASAESLGVRYAGPALKSAVHYRWQVRVRTNGGEWLAPAEAAFSTGLLERDPWKDAKFVTVAAKRGDAEPDTTVVVKTLVNEKEVREAWWFVSAMGVGEFYLNGAEVGAAEKLKPGYTTLEHGRHYYSYDVTDRFNRSAGAKNVLCAEVVSTWWTRMYPWTLPPNENAFGCVLLLRFADGTERRVVSDASWQAAYAGPVQEASLFNGEVYDARVATPWRAAGAPADWKPARQTHFAWARGEMRPLTGPPIVWREDLKHGCADYWTWRDADVVGFATNAAGKIVSHGAIVKRAKSLKIKPGEEIVFDFWQNHAAVPEMVWKGAAGTRATLRFGEMLNDAQGETARGNDGPAGSVYLANLRKAKARVEYVFAGTGAETYVPARTFFGYRYMSVRADGPIEVTSAQAIPVTSIARADETGSFETGDKSVNKLVSNVVWGQRSNYLSVPTDCPQRDERQGWSGDTQVFAATGAYNANTYGFLSKWMEDAVDSSLPTGAFPFVAPFPPAKHLGPSTGWSDAGVVVPHVLYRMFGDRTVLEKNFAAMDKFLKLVAQDPVPHDPVPDFGDWLSLANNGEELKHLLSHAYLVWDAMMMQDAARALGKDPAPYAEIERGARAAFKAKFLDANGELAPKCRWQTCYAYAIALDLVEGAGREKTVAAFAADVEKHGGKLRTGFLGTPFLLPALTKCGRADLAYATLLQHDFPGWLYSVDQGATTIWERWNSYTKDRGFGDVGMNSFNHYAYGCVLQWLYETAAGIRPDWEKPGFRHFFLEPRPDKRLGRVEANFDSPMGRISSTWECLPDGGVQYRFRVPANSEATLVLPGERPTALAPGTYVFTRAAAALRVSP
ncbi:MAG: family 78 glycoside hydrolase catalytic domain [Kiritimatiellae bacterium]|nr:family 78 glycoside hydrolase catalytic domain [Kiritimatiellia bacterium]